MNDGFKERIVMLETVLGIVQMKCLDCENRVLVIVQIVVTMIKMCCAGEM